MRPLVPFFLPKWISDNTAVRVFICALMAALASACAHHIIPGTQAQDTPDNRAVVAVLAHIRQCLQDRDAQGLLNLISRDYFVDNGTPDPKDDYGYLEMKERLVKDTMAVARDVSVSFQVFEVEVQGNRAYADVRYTSRARLELPSGRLWDNFRDFNRIELVREAGLWRVVSGL